MKKYVVFTALGEEYKTLVSLLSEVAGVEAVEDFEGTEVPGCYDYYGQSFFSIGEDTIRVVRVGKPGMIQMAMAVQAYVDGLRISEENFEDYVFINYGTSGAFKYPIGSIHKVKTFINSDWDLTALGEPIEQSYITCEGEGSILYSGSKFVTEPIKDAVLSYLVDMEGYAFATVCSELGIPYKVYKVVSDNFSSKDFEENVSKSVSAEDILIMFKEDKNENI